MRTRWLLSLLLGLGLTACAPSIPDALPDPHSALMPPSPGERVDVDALAARFERSYGKAVRTLSNRTDADLVALFDAADIVAFYAQTPGGKRQVQSVTVMREIFREMETRSIVTDAQRATFTGVLIAARRFDDAGMSVIDIGFDPMLPGVIALEADGTWRARNVDLPKDPYIVAVVGCAVSQSALEEIASNAPLRDAFAQLPTLWLFPADRRLDATFVRDWHRRFPSRKAAYAYGHAAWKDVDFGAMPRFIRVESGRAVAMHSGWASGEIPPTLARVLGL